MPENMVFTSPIFALFSRKLMVRLSYPQLLVLVDKPVAETVERAKELGDLASSKSLVIYAFQNRRWDSDFLSLKRLLSLSESHPDYIGPILEFESQ